MRANNEYEIYFEGSHFYDIGCQWGCNDGLLQISWIVVAIVQDRGKQIVRRTTSRHYLFVFSFGDSEFFFGTTIIAGWTMSSQRFSNYENDRDNERITIVSSIYSHRLCYITFFLFLFVSLIKPHEFSTSQVRSNGLGKQFLSTYNF